MRGVVMYRAGDVRVEEREDPKVIEPTDAIIRLTATCICGSDLWPYRGIEPADHQVMGHEYVGVVEEIGHAVRNVKVGDFVVGSFVISDNTCEICRSGYQSKCVNGEFVAQTIGTQAEKASIPHADGTLVPTPGQPEPDLIPSLLASSDVLGTGWFAAVAAEIAPGKTVAVVGDGAVGLTAVLAAKQIGAERIIAMSGIQSGRSLPASTARPTSSRSAATTAWPGSRSSRMSSAPTAWLRQSAPRSPRCRRSAPLVPVGTWASSASTTRSRSPASTCSSPTSTCTVVRRRSAAFYPT